MAKGKSSSLSKMMKAESKMDKKSGNKKTSASEKKLEKSITKRGGKS